MYADLFHARVDGALAAGVVDDDAWIENDFLPNVGKRGAAVIEARGASSAASAANAAIEHMRDWVKGSDGAWVSMGVPSDGSYGVPEGLICGFPCTCANGEYKIVEGLDLDAFSRAKIDASVAALSATPLQGSGSCNARLSSSHCTEKGERPCSRGAPPVATAACSTRRPSGNGRPRER
jgi:malate dehydrogenase